MGCDTTCPFYSRLVTVVKQQQPEHELIHISQESVRSSEANGLTKWGTILSTAGYAHWLPWCWFHDLLCQSVYVLGVIYEGNSCLSSNMGHFSGFFAFWGFEVSKSAEVSKQATTV